MNTQSVQRLLGEACRVAGVDQAIVTDYELTPAAAPVDILLKLMSGQTMRVELSALPAEIFPIRPTSTRPMPEHATLTEPTPETLEAELPRKKGRK